MSDRELERVLNRLRDWKRVARDPREQFHDIAPKIVRELEQQIREEWPDALVEVVDDE